MSLFVIAKHSLSVLISIMLFLSQLIFLVCMLKINVWKKTKGIYDRFFLVYFFSFLAMFFRGSLHCKRKKYWKCFGESFLLKTLWIHHIFSIYIISMVVCSCIYLLLKFSLLSFLCNQSLFLFLLFFNFVFYLLFMILIYFLSDSINTFFSLSI